MYLIMCLYVPTYFVLLKINNTTVQNRDNLLRKFKHWILPQRLCTTKIFQLRCSTTVYITYGLFLYLPRYTLSYTDRSFMDTQYTPHLVQLWHAEMTNSGRKKTYGGFR